MKESWKNAVMVELVNMAFVMSVLIQEVMIMNKRQERMRKSIQRMIDRHFAEQVLSHACILVLIYITILLKNYGWL